MYMKSKIRIKNIWVIVLPVIWWILTLVLKPDKAFFEYDDWGGSKFRLIKLLFLTALLIGWQFVYKVYLKVKEGSRLYKRGLLFFLLYFALLLVLLVFLWPGAWAWDDIWTLNAIQWYSFFYPWQNVITGIYYDLMMQFLPFPGGIILMQVMIISLCVAYTAAGLEQTFDLYVDKWPATDIFLKLLPFLFMPVLIYNFSGYRAALATHLEIVLIVTLIRSIKDNKEWKVTELTAFGALTLIVSSWRTESFVYMGLVLVLFLICKRICNLKIRIIYAVVLLLAFFGIHKYQANELGTGDYKLVSLMGQCGELVRAADDDLYGDEISKIDKVVSVDIIRANPGTDGSMLYFVLHAVRDGYSEADYSDFMHALIRLSLRYPHVLINERWKTFINAVGFTGLHDNITMSAGLFDEGSQGLRFFTDKDMIASFPPFPGLRSSLIRILCCERDDGTPILLLQKIIWNAALPMLALTVSFIFLLIKKKWRYLLIFAVALCKLCIVTVTQPAGTFMYIYPFYLLGYILIVYWLLYKRRKV